MWQISELTHAVLCTSCSIRSQPQLQRGIRRPCSETNRALPDLYRQPNKLSIGDFLLASSRSNVTFEHTNQSASHNKVRFREVISHFSLKRCLCPSKLASMILSFSVSGFRCFAEKVTLDLKTNSFRHIRSSEGETWTDYTLRTAAIFGANASGKTTLIDAIWALSSALRNSRRSSSRRLYQPTASSRRPNPVSYEVEFVAAGVRYQYKLTLELWGVSYEALHSFPMGRPRKLFIRSQPTSESKI